MAGKKGSQKFEFSCSTGVAASVTELSCYDDGNFYESKADKKKGRPFDTNTVIDCLDGNSGGGDSLEDACNNAFDDFFEKKGIHVQYFEGLKSTSNGLEQKFMCATQAKTMMIACKEGKRGNVIVGLLGGKTTKKAIKKC